MWVLGGGSGRVGLSEELGGVRGGLEGRFEEEGSLFWEEEEEGFLGMGKLVIVGEKEGGKDSEGQFERAQVRDAKKREDHGKEGRSCEATYVCPQRVRPSENRIYAGQRNLRLIDN